MGYLYITFEIAKKEKKKEILQQRAEEINKNFFKKKLNFHSIKFEKKTITISMRDYILINLVQVI